MGKVIQLTTSEWRGELPDVHSRAEKKIWLRDKYCVDGDSATQMIATNDLMSLKERFIDSLPLANCYDGEQGLTEAFKEWKRERK